MDFNFDLDLVQSQKLLLTPQLKQALEILKLNSQELFEYVEEELETNPVLEIEEFDSLSDEEDAILTQELDVWDNDTNYITKTKVRDGENYNELIDPADQQSTTRLSLKEHLLFQLQISDLDEKKKAIGEYLIDNIDENGYLTANLSEVASFFNIPVIKVKKVLEYIQAFDPPGICARTIKECLIIQLEQLNNHDKDIRNIIENCLNDLAENKISFVAKKTGSNVQKVSEVLNFIKTLEPKPGRAFYNNNEIKFMIPDIIVKKIKGKFEVVINEDSIPLLCINKYYKKMVSEDINAESKKFIQSKIDNASWLIKCIEQRKEILIRIAGIIVRKQDDFFEKGKNYIKPLTMKEIIQEIDMHESTVGKAISGKYLQCSWGIFEIRYFFTGKINNNSSVHVSPERIKFLVKSLIDGENKKKPFSDSEIAEELKKQGIEITRWSVAKYRTLLGISCSPKRKKI